MYIYIIYIHTLFHIIPSSFGTFKGCPGFGRVEPLEPSVSNPQKEAPGASWPGSGGQVASNALG